jgi:hypothetical protein
MFRGVEELTERLLMSDASVRPSIRMKQLQNFCRDVRITLTLDHFTKDRQAVSIFIYM